MTREEYHAQKALKEKRRATERRSYEASKGSMDLSFLLLTLLLTGIGLIMLFSASFPSAYYESGDAAAFLLCHFSGFCSVFFGAVSAASS